MSPSRFLLAGVCLAVMCALTLGQEAARSPDTRTPAGGDPFGDAPAASATRETDPATTAPVRRPMRKFSRAGTERRIASALLQETKLEFIETPLRDTVDFLEDLHKVEFQIDLRALDAAGITADVPISITLSAISLASALEHLLQPLELTYVVRDEVLTITTASEAARERCVRLYPVQPLGDAGWDLEIVKKIVQGHSGGEAELLGGYLAVTQSQPAHRRTALLMQQLTVAAGRNRPAGSSAQTSSSR